MHGFRSIELSGRQVWVNNDQRVVQLNIAQILPKTLESDDLDIVKLLKWMKQFSTGGPPRIFVLEVLAPNDSRRWMPQFDKEKKDEIAGLMEKGAFEVVMEDDVPSGANILGERFVLAVKNLERINNYTRQDSSFTNIRTAKKIY